MSPEAQHRAIAMACGWKEEDVSRGFSCVKIEEFGYTYNKISEYVPNYLNDLNAMCEARKVLTHEQRIQFATQLKILILAAPEFGWWDLDAHEAFFLIDATAGQQAEAFLKAINLWKE